MWKYVDIRGLYTSCGLQEPVCLVCFMPLSFWHSPSEDSVKWVDINPKHLQFLFPKVFKHSKLCVEITYESENNNKILFVTEQSSLLILNKWSITHLKLPLQCKSPLQQQLTTGCLVSPINALLSLNTKAKKCNMFRPSHTKTLVWPATSYGRAADWEMAPWSFCVLLGDTQLQFKDRPAFYLPLIHLL